MSAQPARISGAQRPSGRRNALLLLAAVAALAVLVAVLASRTDGGSLTPAQSPVASPSAGPPVPAQGYSVLWQDDFSGPAVDTSRWFLYRGQPEQGPGAYWLPTHVAQANGVLELRGAPDPARKGQYVTAGVNSAVGPAQAYGRYQVRMRVDPGDGVAFAVLLVAPQGPKADTASYVVIASDDGGDRRQIRAGLRTRSHSGAPYTADRTAAVDLTGWHTVGVDWSPGLLTFTLDGKAWGSVRSALVPKTPLALAVQTQALCQHLLAGVCDPPVATPVDLQMDWVSVQAKTG